MSTESTSGSLSEVFAQISDPRHGLLSGVVPHLGRHRHTLPVSPPRGPRPVGTRLHPPRPATRLRPQDQGRRRLPHALHQRAAHPLGGPRRHRVRGRLDPVDLGPRRGRPARAGQGERRHDLARPPGATTPRRPSAANCAFRARPTSTRRRGNCSSSSPGRGRSSPATRPSPRATSAGR
jgi:hypothetical protein